MNGEKTRLYIRLQDTHDLLYTALLIAEQLPATPRTSELLQMLDDVNGNFERLLENAWWKKE